MNWFGRADSGGHGHGLDSAALVSAAANDRSHLLKKVPDSIPDLIAQFAETATSDQDQLVLTSLGIELQAAGLDWVDLANLLRWQIVAHRKADVAGVINAAKAHPNHAARLTDWERKFLNDIQRRGGLLTDKQMSCLQSICESLDMTADDFALKQVARGGYDGCHGG